MNENKNKHTISDLYQMQSLPLDSKIKMTQYRIREWVDRYGKDGVYVSFSGGKDSTVLLDIVRKMYPNIKAVFVDTGLEFPEIREFVKTFDNVDWLKPKMNFKQVIEKYGYPMISKEVSGCVQGARKYLTSILNENTIARQTDRQTDTVLLSIRKDYWNRNISKQSEKKNTTCISTRRTEFLELSDEKSINRFSRGGYDSKYRKLRGIGEYSKRANTDTAGRVKSETCENAGDADKGQETSDKGEYP